MPFQTSFPAIWGKEGLTPYKSLGETMKKLSTVIIITYEFKKKYDLDHENKKFKQGVNRVGKCTRICRGAEARKV